jgi:hypothetical protein
MDYETHFNTTLFAELFRDCFLCHHSAGGRADGLRHPLCLHAIDPQWRQDVICGAALDEMRWGAVGG